MEKVCLYLLGFKALDALNYIAEMGHAHLISYVLIGQDKGVVNDYSNEINSLCAELGVDCGYRSQDKPQLGSASDHKLSLCIGWKWLVLDSKPVIVMHDSLLPKYRGFNPLVSQLINGDKIIGVTALQASDKYDSGQIICQSSIQIDYPIKISEAIEQITRCYRYCTEFIFNHLVRSKELPLISQNDCDATYSLWRDHSDYFINWSQDAHRIQRFIDSVGHPYHGAISHLDGKELRVFDSLAIPDVVITNRSPGKVIFVDDGFPVVVCGKGLLKLLQVVDSNGKSVFPLGKFRARFH